MNQIKFLNKDIKCFIFDMDGTLIDSCGIWGKIDEDFFKKRGVNEVPKDYQELIIHTGLQKGAEMTIERYGFVNDTVEGVIKEWTDASIDQYEHKIPLKPYAKEILELLKQKGIKLALATANDKSLYGPCLKRLEIDSYFDFIIDVNKVKEGKSSPKIFEEVSKYFGLQNNEIVVVEDSLMGLNTAHLANFITVGVDDASSRNVEDKKKAVADIYIDSFKELIENLTK